MLENLKKYRRSSYINEILGDDIAMAYCSGF